jgi:hypothetical protein
MRQSEDIMASLTAEAIESLFMKSIAAISLLLTIWNSQSDDRPAYAREGERVEQEFRLYRDRLNQFFTALRNVIDQQPSSASFPRLELQDSPPASAGRFGYGMLPNLVDTQPAGIPVSVFSYSWPITDGYIAGENNKVDAAEADLRRLALLATEEKAPRLLGLIREYRNLVGNLRTIDQYIQYNQFWQRLIAQDRPRFDQLTKIYDLMQSGEPDIADAITEVLGKPEVPTFLRIDRSQSNRVILHVPLYTDIEDEEFLSKAQHAIEDQWLATDSDALYHVEVEIRKVAPRAEYGAHIDIRAHAAQFPDDGAVLTTGAQTTHSLVGRYVALGPGDLSARTLAHEFGHVLGFRDGYVRGYRDLGDSGFEILELTSAFDDIMSAPREGHVQAAHFRLILDALR